MFTVLCVTMPQGAQQSGIARPSVSGARGSPARRAMAEWHAMAKCSAYRHADVHETRIPRACRDPAFRKVPVRNSDADASAIVSSDHKPSVEPLPANGIGRLATHCGVMRLEQHDS